MVVAPQVIPELIYPAASTPSATPAPPTPTAAGETAEPLSAPATQTITVSVTPPARRTAMAVQFGTQGPGTPPTPRGTGGVFNSGAPTTPQQPSQTPPTPTLGLRLMTTVPVVVAPKTEPPTLPQPPPLPGQTLPESQQWQPTQAALAATVANTAPGVGPPSPVTGTSGQQGSSVSTVAGSFPPAKGSSVSTGGGSLRGSVGAPSDHSSVAGSSILAAPPPSLTVPLAATTTLAAGCSVEASPSSFSEPGVSGFGGTMQHVTVANTMAGVTTTPSATFSPLSSGRHAALMQPRPSSTGRHRSAAFPGIGSMALGRPRTSPQLGAAEVRRPHSANTRSYQQPRLAQTTMYMAGGGDRLRDRSRAGSRTASRGSSTGRVAVNGITGTVNVIVGPSRSASPAPGRVSSRAAPSRQSGRSSAIRAPSPQSAMTQIWTPIWAELLELVEKWRTGGPGTERATGQQLPPDPGRTRKVCQVLASVVNQVPDVNLRRILLVLTEELFHATFRDYSFAYNPSEDRWIAGATQNLLGAPSVGSPGRGATVRSTQPLPHLSEETVANAVPYFAVVQSLRDAAKDAIMRRLELEAKCASEANGEAEQKNSRPSTPRGQVASLRANEELQLREELRHARLLADTYQARTLELERLRLENEEEVSRVRFERETDSMRRQKLENEARRLRAEVEALRAERAYHAEASKAAGVGYALQEAANKVMRAESISRDKRKDRRTRTESTDSAGNTGASDDDRCPTTPMSVQESSQAETDSTFRGPARSANSRGWQRSASDGSSAASTTGGADIAAGRKPRRGSDASTMTSSGKQLPQAGGKRVRSAAREENKGSPKSNSKAPSTPKVGTPRSSSGLGLRLGSKSATGNT